MRMIAVGLNHLFVPSKTFTYPNVECAVLLVSNCSSCTLVFWSLSLADCWQFEIYICNKYSKFMSQSWFVLLIVSFAAVQGMRLRDG